MLSSWLKAAGVPAMYVCICAAVSDRQIKEAVRDGACSLDHLAVCLGVGTVCGCCRQMAQEILQRESLVENSPHTHVREVSRLAMTGRPV